MSSAMASQQSVGLLQRRNRSTQLGLGIHNMDADNYSSYIAYQQPQSMSLPVSPQHPHTAPSQVAHSPMAPFPGPYAQSPSHMGMPPPATSAPVMSAPLSLDTSIPQHYGHYPMSHPLPQSQPLSSSLSGSQHWSTFEPLSAPAMTSDYSSIRRESMPTLRSQPSYSPEYTQSPYIKPETGVVSAPQSVYHGSNNMAAPSSWSTPSMAVESREPATTIVPTDIDNLMKVVQEKATTDAQAEKSATAEPTAGGASRVKRRYNCPQPGCDKDFLQKTHLEIHLRAHTGFKPFKCSHPGCNQSFSQLGNLKTHQRRHTGERPFKCNICGKSFAQRGNVNAHKIVHTSTKPFTCKLDDCNKHFTQLGNLKSHQNKFHTDTIRKLRERFRALGLEAMSPHDREMWEYFTTLYKNCNKGIKGRGKDRRIATTAGPSTLLNPSMYKHSPHNLGPSAPGSNPADFYRRDARHMSSSNDSSPTAPAFFHLPMQGTSQSHHGHHLPPAIHTLGSHYSTSSLPQTHGHHQSSAASSSAAVPRYMPTTNYNMDSMAAYML